MTGHANSTPVEQSMNSIHEPRFRIDVCYGVVKFRPPTYTHKYEHIGWLNWRWSATCNETGAVVSMEGFWTKRDAIKKTAEYRAML